VNINTATILNLLSPKIDATVKEKISSLSVDGKIDIATISKDKGVQTILINLFKDIATGSKTKENIASLLENNKQNFSFKNLSEDIKTLVKSIQADPSVNSKLETQIASLKSSLIDIKRIDEKMIKSNINNSGVLLESKLAQQVTPLSKNIEQILSLIKGQLEIVSDTQIKSDMPKDLKLDIKNAIENILKNIKNLQQESNVQNQSSFLAKISSGLKSLQEDISLTGQKVHYKTPTLENMESLKTQLKEQLGILNGSVNIENIKTKLAEIQSNANIPKDLKLEVKNAVESLLRDIKNLNTQHNPQKQLQTLSSLETKIISLETKVLLVNTPYLSSVKSDIITSIKDLFVNLKEQIVAKNFVDIKNGFTLIDQKITPFIEQNSTAKSIKGDIANLFEQLKTLTTTKVPQQQQLVLQNIVGNTQVMQSKIESFPKELFENNLSKKRNFINDLKITAAVIEEHIHTSKEPVSKDLKTVIDKINTQIDFYQLLSYSTNSTHTYLSFLQDEIEDSDIKFHKNKDESFSCQINLTLKQYGDLKILMILDNKNNININIGLEQEALKSLVQENLQKLRIGINSIELMLQSLNIFSLNTSEQKSIQNGYGFNNNELNFGLDIKA